MQFNKHVTKRPASPISEEEMKALCQYIVNIPNEEILQTLYATIANNSGGVQNMDYKMVKAFNDAFTKFKSQKTESRKTSKMKLTESQTRRAVRKWLFEYATDSGVSHRASTDDKIAGKLGDDREDQPASMIPQEIPIVATSQMSTQLTHEMPAIEDPNFVPGTVSELGKAVDLIAQQVPHSEIEWFYDKMQEIADEAIVTGNKLTLLMDYWMMICNSMIKSGHRRNLVKHLQKLRTNRGTDGLRCCFELWANLDGTGPER